ncbi:hypothetical protein T484DRAFT_1781209 [Baffinella frigidus]|nr:hypothetical protein T484DRAFT_1781209 [Cryptophyta sp. CCMP2293]
MQEGVVPPEGPPLPPGWEFAYDPSNVVYYYSHDLNISQYPPGEADAIGPDQEGEPATFGNAGSTFGNREVHGGADVRVRQGGADVVSADFANLKLRANLGELPPVSEDSDAPPQPSLHPKPVAQCGLGVTLKLNAAGCYYVKRMEAGGPAALSGRIEGMDTLIAVDGVAVTGLEYKDLARLDWTHKDLARLDLGLEGSYLNLAMISALWLEYKDLARLVLGPEGSYVNLAMISHSENAAKEGRREQLERAAAREVEERQADLHARQLEQVRRHEQQRADEERQSQVRNPTVGNP